MIEQSLIEHLEACLVVSAYAEQPGTVDGRYIVLERTGGTARCGIRHATIAVQSYADSMTDAAQLCNEVIEAMERLTEYNDVSACSLTNYYNFTDTSQRKYRYQAVFEITYYE